MKYLREIAQIVTRYREKNLDVIDDEPSQGDTDYISKLYYGFKENKVTTDLSAAELVYGAPKIDTKYTTLKNRLKRKLLNLLFFLDIREPDFSEFSVARYQNAKNLFWINTLVGFGARNSSVKLAESGLTQALKYDFTWNSLQYLLVLRNYSRFSGSERQYDKYDQMLRNQLRTFEAELVAQELYERLTIRFSRSAAEQPDLIDVCQSYLSQLDAYKSSIDSFNFNLYYYRLRAHAKQIGQQYLESVNTCEDATQYFDKHKHVAYKLLYAEFYLQELTCFLQLREYTKGKELVEICRPLYIEGGANWFNFMEYQFLLEMHTLHFKEASEVLLKTTSNNRFQFQSEEIKEKWIIYGLYLDFALRHTHSDSISGAKSQMDPDRFLRTVPNFKKDKRGYNIAILILHIIMLLEKNDFGSIISRMDALRTYRNRYLQVSTNRRSALFFKMLQIMESNSFDPTVTAVKSKQYFDRLSARTSDVVEVQEGVQILSFEWLWQAIIKMLEEKQKQGKL
ncbi:MAG TPA: hypothetical protein VEW28_00835 [Candidatus Kapabacteria bacterium]|nr:hypothetical protein [Candidatus Kapabacteria bacterium]